MNMSLRDTYREKVDTFVAVCHHLAKHQYVTGHGGNMAWKLEDDLLLITPTQTWKGDVTADNVVFINFKGEKIEGEHKPTGETPMYVKFFAERPDIQSVLHCHPPHVNAFAIADGADELMRPFYPETITEVGPVPLVPYGEPLTQRLADHFSPFLAKYNAFLMENHGLVIMSPWDLKWVQMCTDLLEMTAKHIILAKSMGHPLKEVSYADIQNLGNVMRTRDLPLFGAPGAWSSLEEIYFPQGAPAAV